MSKAIQFQVVGGSDDMAREIFVLMDDGSMHRKDSFTPAGEWIAMPTPTPESYTAPSGDAGGVPPQEEQVDLTASGNQ